MFLSYIYNNTYTNTFNKYTNKHKQKYKTSTGPPIYPIVFIKKSTNKVNFSQSKYSKV